nr:MAG TPA: hypothetical protein [Caudoviricetes sp.]
MRDIITQIRIHIRVNETDSKGKPKNYKNNETQYQSSFSYGKVD